MKKNLREIMVKRLLLLITSLCVLGHGSAHAAVTFSSQVVRILQSNCQVCHHTGGLAPFPLISYTDAFPRARTIKSAVVSRRMPDGAVVRLETGCSSANTFEGIRQLTRQEIDTIVQWVDEGALEGDPAQMPAPLTFDDRALWKAGTPELMIPNTPGGFVVPPHLGRDVFRRFPIRTYFDADRYLNSFEALPGSGDDAELLLNRIVHHVTLFVDPDCKSLEQEAAFAATRPEVPGAGFEGEFTYPTTLVGMWFPGSDPLRLQEGVGIKVPRSTCLVMEVHYATYNQEPVVDHTVVGLKFAHTPVMKERLAVLVKNEQFTVPAGEPRYRVNGSLVLPQDVTLYSLTPHAHQLGTDFLVEAVLPNGRQVCLADVAWDFRHQGTHIFRQPVRLPAGTEMAATCWYDNSANNPNQVSQPPIDVPFGRAAEKEMCQLTVGLTIEPSAGTTSPLPPRSRSAHDR